MSRNTIKYLLKQSLQQQAAYGRSKHSDKINTYQKRESLRQQGATKNEILAVNEMKEYIYSYGTMHTYQQQVSYFGDYLIENGYKKISLEQSKELIQEYIDHLHSSGKSPWTINLALSAICKATSANIRDYNHPKRTISQIKRGNEPREHDSGNEKRYSKILEANRLLGLRRNELKALRASDILERDDKVIVMTIGKGGRHNQQIFTLPSEKEAVLNLRMGKSEHEKIFSSSDFKNDVDFHAARQERAITVYNRVVEDMKFHPERRSFYTQIIKDIFHEKSKILRENLDNPYCVRGANRQRLMKEGKELTYDRVVILYTSVTVLNHTRSDVTVEHYIAKS